jgi:hypothetical protein
MSGYKTFDFDIAMGRTHNPDRISWLKFVCFKPLSEEDFVIYWSSYPRAGRHPHKKYSPSASRYQYRRLQKNFGFFIS